MYYFTHSIMTPHILKGSDDFNARVAKIRIDEDELLGYIYKTEVADKVASKDLQNLENPIDIIIWFDFMVSDDDPEMASLLCGAVSERLNQLLYYSIEDLQLSEQQIVEFTKFYFQPNGIKMRLDLNGFGEQIGDYAMGVINKMDDMELNDRTIYEVLYRFFCDQELALKEILRIFTKNES